MTKINTVALYNFGLFIAVTLLLISSHIAGINSPIQELNKEVKSTNKEFKVLSNNIESFKIRIRL